MKRMNWTAGVGLAAAVGLALALPCGGVAAAVAGDGGKTSDRSPLNSAWAPGPRPGVTPAASGKREERKHGTAEQRKAENGKSNPGSGRQQGDAAAPAEPRLPPPWLVVPPMPREKGSPMELRELSVRARVAGLQAEVETTLTFFNPNGRNLEGELRFPLPDGAVVTGYALDINGAMVDGVVVKKEKARVAFETEVRRGIDPGLVEHVAGNIYSTRVCPLPAHGTRTVRLKYVVELPTDAKGGAACHLPLPAGADIAKLAVRIVVERGPVKPELGGFGDLKFAEFADQWVAEKAFTDAKPDGDILVALPELPAQMAAVELDAKGDAWFAVTDLPMVAFKAGKLPPAPREVGIAWDASGSREAGKLAKELALLKELRALWPDTKFSVLVFRDRPETIRPLEDAEELAKLAYDGGTDLAAAAAAIRGSGIGRWLLFTDGFDTLSGALPEFGGKDVTAVVGQTQANRELLRQACGELVDLQRANVAEAAAAVQSPSPRLLRVTGGGIADVQGVGAPAWGRVTVYGRLTADEADVRLEYSDGSVSPAVKLSRKTAAAGTLVASVWAARRVAWLSVHAGANEEELLALGRKFGIVSPATSLIVLETLEQYVRNEIEPPASLPEMRRQWSDAIEAQGKKFREERASKLVRVVKMWDERVKWWETKFDPAAKPKIVEPAEPAPVADGEVSRVVLAERRSYGFGGRAAAAASGRAAGTAPHAPPATASSYMSLAEPEGGDGKKDTSAGASPATITVKAWDPAMPYLKAIKAAAKAERYAAYLAERKTYAASPAFFVDCAEFFLREGDAATGVRVLTNLAELKLEDAPLLRLLAWRLQQAGELDRAITILRRVQKLRPEEPQSCRDLALALAEAGKNAEAAELLLKVAMGEWQRFEEIELIALEELNALLARTGTPPPAGMDQRLVKNLDVDVRIVMSWDADNTDVDLHMIEPSGEEAYYGHNRTSVGGLVSRDFTQGYGPEEYMVRRAPSGMFKIFAHYYGSHQQTVIGACTLTATVFTDFGRPTQKKQVLTLRLDTPRDRADIGEVEFGK